MILFAVKKQPVKFEKFLCTNTECITYDSIIVELPAGFGKNYKLPQCFYCQEDSLTELPATSPGGEYTILLFILQ